MFRSAHPVSHTTSGRRGQLVPYVAFGIVALGVVNFLWFMAETLPLNLIPSDHRIIDGHYYLWSKLHGGLVEVGQQAYRWLPVHEAILFLSWPLVMLAGGTLVFRHLARRIAGSSAVDSAGNRSALVRLSGPALASARTGGTIGRIWFSRPLLRVHVHPGGVVVKPPFLSERAILASEITAVTPDGGLSEKSTPSDGPVLGVGVSEVSTTYRPRGPFLRVDHAGVGMATPLVIAGGRWDVAEAFLSIAGPTPETPPPGVVLAMTTADTGLPVGIQRAGQILGVVVAVVLIWAGITFAIPQLGLPGVAWTAGLIAIVVINVRKYVLNSRR